MKLFDEHLREIFLYDYGEGDSESSWSIILFAYRDIPEEEFKAVQSEYEQIKQAYQNRLLEAQEKSGIKRMRELSGTKDRASEEESRAAMERFSEANAGNAYPPWYFDFLCEKLGLQTLEADRSI